MSSIFAYFRTGKTTTRLSDPNLVQRLYERKRWSVFLSLLIGYGFFYVARINFSVAKKPMLDAGIMNASQMGLMGSGLLLVYSVGRFTNGFLADRCNIRRFMSTALLLSALANLLLGFNPGFGFFLVLWAMNGWFQSVGSAPSVVSLSQWFGRSERGTRYGIWSSSHSIGEGITFAGTGLLVSVLGWRYAFWGPGLACLIVAVVISRTLADRPETYGLPPISEYKNEHEPPAEKTESVGKLQLEVIRHPGIWMLAIASACLYIARYGMSSWGPLYLQLGKGYSAAAAGGLLSVYPLTQIAGSISSGFVSDHFFHSRRTGPALIYGVIEITSLAALYLIPSGHQVLDAIALGAFGFALGGLLVYFGGLMAIDLVSSRAAGAAMGLVGLFSYLVAAIQDAASGLLIDRSRTVINGVVTYDFEAVFALWIGALVVSLLMASLIHLFQKRNRKVDLVTAT